jgi:hypothetical protein
MAEDLASALLLSEEQLAAERAKKTASGKRLRAVGGGREPGFFVVPAAWAQALTRAKCRDTRNIAWGLLRKAGGGYRGEELYLPSWEAAQAGVPRDGRKAALKELEALGLIELRRRGRGVPFAIILRSAQ